jgi:uncharacterized membrane protein
MPHALHPILASSWVDGLFGLSRVSWSDPRAALSWSHELPAWLWVVLVLGVVLLAVWSYQRLLGPRPARVALGVLRALIVLLVIALLAGPTLVVRQEHVEPDWLLVLVDRSASMGIQDMVQDQGGSQALVTRDDALRAALQQHAAVFGDEQLGKERRLLWLGFDSGTFQLASGAGAVELPQPQGQGTSLRTAIEQALQRAAGRPISGVVLFSDGRSPQRTGADVVRRLEQQAAAVFAVPLGSQHTPLDLAVAQVDAPDEAFINDTVPVTVWIDRYPADGAVDPARVKVRLVDRGTGHTLDEKPASEAGLDQPVRLSAASAQVGQQQWRVELVYDQPPEGSILDRELILENNRRDVDVELIDRPVRVLYVDGYPRWEYRYLKNLLVREQSLESSVLLVSADRGFVQEGDVALTRVPNTARELEPFDVIVIGDVPSSYFSPQQLTLLRDHVATRGAGLLWIAGQWNTPRSYENTALATLLPMRRAAVVDRIDANLGPLVIKPTPLAESLNVLALRSAPGKPVDPNWPAALPGLLWVQSLGELKPAVESLADVRVSENIVGPLITRQRFGTGQSVYVASDDLWRWRYGRGDQYYDQFWTQLVRMLGRSRLQQEGPRVRLAVSTRQAGLDQPVIVTLKIDDPLLAKRDLPRIAVAVIRPGPDGAGGATVERLELLPVTPAAGEPGSTPSEAREFRALWRPTVSGKLMLRVVEPALDDLNITQPVEVIRPDDELRHPLPDHDRLAQLASQTGGAVVSLEELPELARLVPNRARRTPNDIREPLWDTYLALGLVVGLLAAEWIGRKLVRLA